LKPVDQNAANKFLVIIAGPTASGKTRLAVDVARRYGADVFSADSRQIYKQMVIGTARPTPEEMQGVKHHFIGEVSIFDGYSTGQFVEDALHRLETYYLNNVVAVMAGGTGMYIKALIDGLDDFPDISPEVRDLVRKGYESGGLPYLQQEVGVRDPEYMEMADIFNPRRLMRALEVCLETGETFSGFLGKKTGKNLFFTPVYILIDPDRQTLYAHINARVDKMMDAGLLEEARSLFMYKGVHALDTVGYKELFDYMDGIITLEKAVELIKQNSRRYAKRQMTWFRNHGEWHLSNPAEKESLFKYLVEKIGGSHE